MTLLDKLCDAGLTVRPFHDWETRTNRGRDRVETVGILNHWDAIKGTPEPAYYTQYPPHNSYKGDLYHGVIRRDGLVDLLGQRYAWHAGSGSSQILAIAQAGGEIPDDSAGPDNQNGNPHFWSWCINYHPNEGPVPRAQYNALVIANRVCVDHFRLNVGQVARHMDWTTRKRDIDTIDLAQFRQDISANEEEAEVLPITKDSSKEDIRFIQGLVGAPLTGEWDADTVQAVTAKMGQYTNHPNWQIGLGVGGAQLSGFLKDLASSDHDHDYVKDVVVRK